jgi:hypothetical protein
MTQDEIRKLLGGYSTNALSADERRILFEAALEDQELFNALQDEDALRGLLADPISRDQVRRALETPRRDARRASFWSQRWLLGVAIPAVVAVIAIVIMNRANAPRLIAPPVQIASEEHPSSETALSQYAAQPKAKAIAKDKKMVKEKTIGKAEALDQVARAIPPLAPQLPAPAPAQFESPRAATARVSIRGATLAPIPDAIRQQFAAGLANGFVSNAPLYQGPLVRYSLLRSGPAGDEVRVQVSTGVAGYLALYQVNPNGTTQRVYPANEPTVLVQADRTIQIPDSPLRIADAGTKLRLVVVSVAAPAAIGQITTGQSGVIGGAVNGAVTLGTGNAPNQTQPTPMVIDIPLAPN